MFLQPSLFLENIIRFLMPFFLGAATDLGAARADILETLASYGARTRSELLNAAQVIAFGMSTLDTLAEAKHADLSVSMRLRYRGCANGLNRAAQQNEKALERKLACDHAVPAIPRAEPVNDISDTAAQQVTEQAAVRIETARNRLAAPHLATPHPTVPNPAVPRPSEAQGAAPPPAATQGKAQNIELWGNAMREALSQMGLPGGSAPAA